MLNYQPYISSTNSAATPLFLAILVALILMIMMLREP